MVKKKEKKRGEMRKLDRRDEILDEEIGKEPPGKAKYKISKHIN